jgi:hypothetical protein
LCSIMYYFLIAGMCHLKDVGLLPVALASFPFHFSLLQGEMLSSPYFYWIFRFSPFNFDCLFLFFFLLLKFYDFSILISIYNDSYNNNYDDDSNNCDNNQNNLIIMCFAILVIFLFNLTLPMKIFILFSYNLFCPLTFWISDMPFWFSSSMSIFYVSLFFIWSLFFGLFIFLALL